MDQTIARRSGRRISEKSHRVSRRNGGARQISAAVSGVWLPGAAHRLRRERKQLLREVSDGGTVARGSVVVALTEGHVAETARRSRMTIPAQSAADDVVRLPAQLCG